MSEDSGAMCITIVEEIYGFTQNPKSLDTLTELAAYSYHDRVTIRRLIYG